MRKKTVLITLTVFLAIGILGLSTLVANENNAAALISPPVKLILKFHAGDAVVRSLIVDPTGSIEWQNSANTAKAEAVSVWTQQDGVVKPYLAEAQMSTQVDTREFVIGPGDILDINIWKHEEVSRQVPVRPDGRISLPLLGDVTAAGLAPADLKVKLQSSFSRYFSDPEVTVIISEVRSYQIFVQGMVANPGTYPISGRTTLVQSISLAGGFTEFANRRKIIILRSSQNGTKRMTVNYDDIVDGDRNDEVLRPGDSIIVP